MSCATFGLIACTAVQSFWAEVRNPASLSVVCSDCEATELLDRGGFGLDAKRRSAREVIYGTKVASLGFYSAQARRDPRRGFCEKCLSKQCVYRCEGCPVSMVPCSLPLVVKGREVVFPSIIVDVLGGTGVPGPCAPRVPMRRRLIFSGSLERWHVCGCVARQAQDVRGGRVGLVRFWSVPTVREKGAQWQLRGEFV